MSNKIVITGASGFLGRHLLERLKNDEEYQVFAFSSHPEDLREKITGTNITYCHKDCLFDDSMKQTLRDSTVINCAYPRNSLWSFRPFLKCQASLRAERRTF